MTKLPLHTQFASIESLREALQSRELSAAEVARSALDAVEANADLNAFLHVDAELTLKQAAEADDALKNGTAGKLAGIPIGHRMYWSPVVMQHGGQSDARRLCQPLRCTVVSQLANAGAVSLGKLNCDEFAMGSGNETSAFGPARNPWDHSAVPGGSSGGSAAPPSLQGC